MHETVCALLITATTMALQSSSPSSWVDVWQGELEGLPSVVLTLATDGGQLQGTLVLNVGDRRAVLRAGDSFQFKSTVPHSVRNESRETARVLWVMNTLPPVVHL